MKPSTSTIQVRIPLKHTFFLYIVFENNENEQKQAGVGLLLKNHSTAKLQTDCLDSTNVKFNISKATGSKPVRQEVSCTVILSLRKFSQSTLGSKVEKRLVIILNNKFYQSQIK